MSEPLPFATWEIDVMHIWAKTAGVYHACESIVRVRPESSAAFAGSYRAEFACTREEQHFHGLCFTTGFFLRTGSKSRRCRGCVAELQRRHMEGAGK